MSSSGRSVKPTGRALVTLSLAALGVVYGDIGTSPLYALKECFHGLHAIPLTQENVVGLLSLIFWSLNFLISFKYVVHMMRADNRGEGGILALLALLNPAGLVRGGRWALISAGLFGAALLYGDGIITPAISVLGAMDGLGVAVPSMARFILPISLAIVTLLFLVQKHGTETVGRIFGPVTTIWFICIAILGVRGILLEPSVLAALWPGHAVMLFAREGWTAFFVLAAVVLVVTGGEALYADMGHFGKRPIRYAWFGVVLPALVHMTNLVINGIPERFPKLKIVMVESGLAWIPFLMQRLDNEYLMRTSEAPLLKKKPSEYMAENFYYSTQPMETSE